MLTDNAAAEVPSGETTRRKHGTPCNKSRSKIKADVLTHRDMIQPGGKAHAPTTGTAKSITFNGKRALMQLDLVLCRSTRSNL